MESGCRRVETPKHHVGTCTAMTTECRGRSSKTSASLQRLESAASISEPAITKGFCEQVKGSWRSRTLCRLRVSCRLQAMPQQQHPMLALTAPLLTQSPKLLPSSRQQTAAMGIEMHSLQATLPAVEQLL